MATKRRVNSNINYKKLTSKDVLCPLCRSILIKPIRLPCKHGFCASCFDVTMGNANLVCPLCRVRVGSWLRSARKSKNLIDEDFWKAIQDLFPLQVRSKLSRMDENFRKNTYTIEEVGDNILQKRGVKTNSHQNFIMQLKAQELQLRHETDQFKAENVLAKKITQQLIDSSAASASATTDAAGNNNQTKNSLLNNFANKEYTCRILCQSDGKNGAGKKGEIESLIQMRNKQLQRLAEVDNASDRSNSIESEYLYFKPIDYRHNPPTKGIPPIKVPPQRPIIINTNIQILPPGGPNGLHMHSLESAFARLFPFSTLTKDVKDDVDSTVEKVEIKESNSKAVTPRKRKYVKSASKSRKKLKSPQKTPQSNEDPVHSPNKSPLFPGFDSVAESPKQNNQRKNCTDSNKPLLRKKRLQEEADFELARKLQEAFNQSSMYSTRSRVPKLTGSKR